MNVAEYLIERLTQIGVEHVFAVPGDYAGSFMLALDAAPGITRIGNMLELGCGYAADGYARFKGAGAACVQYSVGSMSLLTCAAGSFVERVPVVVISASPSTADRVLERTEQILFHHSTGNLRVDQEVFKNVTVASEIIHSGTAAPAQIDSALEAMLTHRRPVYIEVLQNVWTETCVPPVGTIKAKPLQSDPASVKAAVDAAYAAIEAAVFPVLWLGVEIQRYGLQAAAQALVNASGLLFSTTSLGKTVLDESQAAFLGTYAGPASPDRTNAALLGSDCPVALGAIITDDYLDIMKESYCRMIAVNDQTARVGHQYFINVTLEDFVNGLLARYQAEPQRPRAYNLPAPPVAPEPAAEGTPLTYTVFYDELSAFMKARDLFKDSALILGESTSLYVFGNLFGMPPNSFVANAAWGSLGHETGSAIGVMLGSGKRAYVIAGDGGFRMVAQELSTMANAKVNAVVFVMSNNVYAIEQAFVDIKAFTPTGQFAAFDVLPKWNYLALAQAFGAEGRRVHTAGELRHVLEEVQSITDRPTLVEVVIPEKDLAPQLKRLAETP